MIGAILVYSKRFLIILKYMLLSLGLHHSSEVKSPKIALQEKCRKVLKKY